MKRNQIKLLIAMFLLTSCGKSTSFVGSTATFIPATAMSVPTATNIPNTATPLPPTETATPTQDPTIFGAIGTGDIQAMVPESVVNAIFKKTMDGFVANNSIQEYQIINITVFPSGSGLLAEIIYSVKTSESAWLTDGGAQLADGWISNNCSRFDFFTTNTEYQLKNRRLCS